MPIPTVVTDLSTTIASNSPAATDSPGEGDDHIRALAAFIAQSYAGTLTATFKVNANGVPYSTSMHNPGGTLTGTTNQLICSGTYTPTLTNSTNVSSSTANANTTYARVGNVVSVAGTVDITPTAGSTETVLGISLPIASSLTTSSQLGGTGAHVTTGGSLAIAGRIFANAVGDRAELNFYTSDSGASRTWSFHFQYLIL